MKKKNTSFSQNHQSSFFCQTPQLQKMNHLNSDKQNQLLSLNQSYQHKNPNKFNNYRQYICSIIGFAVGFGSFWRFPYLIYKNGGGTFLIPYFLALFLIGIPLLYLQTVVGQIHGHSLPFTFLKINKGLKFVGLTFVLVSLHNSGYYNIILTYCYRYLLSSFTTQLPFKQQQIMANKYFNEEILKKSPSIQQFGGINYQLFILYTFSLGLCHYIIKDGVKFSGKIMVYTAFIPYIFLTILFLRGIFLKGAGEGLKYLFVPKLHFLFNYQIWVDAFVQVFYQISIATGTIVHLSSMKPKNQEFLIGIYLMPLSFVICGFLCAINVFMYLGHFCFQANILIEDINLSGPQLSFNVFPKALAILPFPNLWVFLFFFSMVFLGIDTQFGFIQTIYCYIKDQFKYNSPIRLFKIQIKQQTCKIIVLGIIMVMAPSLTSFAGIFYMEFYDFFTNSIPLSVGILIQLYVFVYIIPYQQLQRQIKQYTNTKTPDWIRKLLQSQFLVYLLIINLGLSLIDQILLYKSYSIKFYLLGWIISVYPFCLAYIYYIFNKQQVWRTSFKELKQVNGKNQILIQLLDRNVDNGNNQNK